MSDLTTLTHDQLADSFAAHFAELESRLSAAGYSGILREARIGHAIMSKVHGKLADFGAVSPNSAGGPKP